MASLLEYVQMRGDLTFDERPLTPADNFVLCALTYVDLALIWPEQSPASFTLEWALEKMLKLDAQGIPILRSIADVSRELITEIAHSRRFGSLLLENLQEQFDPHTHTQMFGMCVHYCGNNVHKPFYFVAFRGTDNSLVGWEENFMLSFSVPHALTLARDFTRECLTHAKGSEEFYVAGHSKGGVLAEYGAAALDDDERARLTRVFTNDGPRIDSAVLEWMMDERLEGKLTSYVPEYSIVGSIMNTETTPSQCVASTQKGIMQHDITSWQVSASGIIPGNPDSESAMVNRIIDRWARGIALEDREKILAEFFGLLRESGVKSVDDIWQDRSVLTHLFSSRKKISDDLRAHGRQLFAIARQEVAARAKESVGQTAKGIGVFARSSSGREGKERTGGDVAGAGNEASQRSR